MALINKSTLSEQIYDVLRDDILKQNIRCGEKLTLKVLKERFQVSSTPIRDALTRLAQDGLAVYYPNIGITVIELDSTDLRELYEFIGDLDGLAIRYAARHPDQDALKEELDTSAQMSQKYLKADLVESWQECSDSFHLIFYKYCSNSRLIESAARIRSQLTIFSNMYSSKPEAQSAIQEHHEKIITEYIHGGHEQAAISMKEHVMNSLQYAEKILMYST